MSEQDFLTIEQLSKITKLKDTTLRTYLGRAEFNKYSKRRKINERNKYIYFINEEFIKNLFNFLILRKLKNNAKALKDYWSAYQKSKGDITMKEKDLEKKYEIISKQYESLLERYKEIVTINKKLETIEKICQEPADSMPVFELQTRIKEILND